VRYERPRIVSKEAIVGLLVVAKSDVKKPDGV
jgi:hypothetical protein